MKKVIQPGVWTQLNTNTDKFLIQNTGGEVVTLVSSPASTPPLTTDVEVVLDRYSAISHNLANKIFWGKPLGNNIGLLGIVE